MQDMGKAISAEVHDNVMAAYRTFEADSTNNNAYTVLKTALQSIDSAITTRLVSGEDLTGLVALRSRMESGLSGNARKNLFSYKATSTKAMADAVTMLLKLPKDVQTKANVEALNSAYFEYLTASKGEKAAAYDRSLKLLDESVSEVLLTGKLDRQTKQTLKGLIRTIDSGNSVNDNDIEKASNNTAGFQIELESILSKHGVTLEEFNKLRLTKPGKLTNEQRATMKAIRDSIPMPDAETMLQKIIPYELISKYLDGEYTQIGGYLARAEDVEHLATYQEIFESLRLDYRKTRFKPRKDSSMGVILFKTNNPDRLSIPYGIDMGGTEVNGEPFTGNGFTKALNGDAIPELVSHQYMGILDGAELYEVFKDGKWVLKGKFNEDEGIFIRQ